MNLFNNFHKNEISFQKWIKSFKLSKDIQFFRQKRNVINFIQTNNCAQGKKENIFPRIIFPHHKSALISKGWEFHYKMKKDNKLSLTKTAF